MADLSQYTPANITDDDKLWGAIMYAFPIMGPITMFAMKDKLQSQFIHFHAIQSTAWLVTTLILSFVTCGLGTFIVFLGWWFAFQAYSGQMVSIPVLTDQLVNRGKFDAVKQLPG